MSHQRRNDFSRCCFVTLEKAFMNQNCRRQPTHVEPQLSRREVGKKFVGGVLALSGLGSGVAQGQSFPDKPIRILVPAPAGTTYDIYARRYAPHLSQLLGQAVIVDNKPGAAGNIAMEQLVRAPADGYTLAIAFPTELGLLRTLGYPYVDTETLLTPLGLFSEGAPAIMVSASLGIKNFADLSKYLKERSKPADLAIGPLYSSSHVIGHTLSKELNHRFNFVPYKAAGAALPDLASGVIPLALASASESAPYLQSGRVQAIAYLAPWRSPMLPEVPTIGELGMPNLTNLSSGLFVGHREIPEVIQLKLHDALNKISNMSEVREKLLFVGGRYTEMTLAELRRYHLEGQALWRRRAQDSGIKYIP
jgi:tripartite-type tricarboxylate transporter receptor subunit TctC